MRTVTVECDECEKDWKMEIGENDVSPVKTCKGCERTLCWACFYPHECSYHPSEIEIDKEVTS